jgi:hypothetical protein
VADQQSAKDFVEHLRAVHFALVAASIGLIVLASLKSTSQLAKAHAQVQTMLGVLNSWDEEILFKRAKSQAQESRYFLKDPDFKSYRITLRSKKESAIYRIDPPGRDWFIDYPSFPSYLLHNFDPSNYGDGAATELRLNRPATINQFKLLWNLLNGRVAISRPSVVDDGCEAIEWEYDDGGGGAPLPVEGPTVSCRLFFGQQKTDQDASFSSLELKKKDGYSGYHKHPDWYYEGSTRDDFLSADPLGEIKVMLPVGALDSMVIKSNDLLPALNTAWQVGSFEDNFRDLEAVGKELADSDFRTAERVLAAEEDRSDTAFELVGIKLPSQVALRWGIAIITLLQLYMLVHLMEFRNRDNGRDARDVAWIGNYDSHLAHALLGVSLLILPCLAVLDLTFTGIKYGISHAWLAFSLGNALSITLSLGQTFFLPRKHKEECDDFPV